jgi:hypothetical protein
MKHPHDHKPSLAKVVRFDTPGTAMEGYGRTIMPSYIIYQSAARYTTWVRWMFQQYGTQEWLNGFVFHAVTEG